MAAANQSDDLRTVGSFGEAGAGGTILKVQVYFENCQSVFHDLN